MNLTPRTAGSLALHRALTLGDAGCYGPTAVTIKLDALGETRPFEGFDQADFDAFEPKKWASRVYTMERRVAREKLVALARELQATANEEAPLDLGASDDAPSMVNHRKVQAVWSYLTRPKQTRELLGSRLSKTDLADADALFDIAVEQQHASLLLRIDHDGFRFDLHISRRAHVDRMNAANKLRYQDDQAALIQLCQALPDSALCGFEPDLAHRNEISTDRVIGWAEFFESSSAPFVVRLPWPRETEVLAGTEILSALKIHFPSMLALHTFFAWAKDNDFAKVATERAVEKADKKLKKTTVSSASKGPELTPGARVTILSGLFAGRAGYLAELDTKGNVKVMVGPVSVSVPVNDVKVL